MRKDTDLKDCTWYYGVLWSTGNNVFIRYGDDCELNAFWVSRKQNKDPKEVFQTDSTKCESELNLHAAPKLKSIQQTNNHDFYWKKWFCPFHSFAYFRSLFCPQKKKINIFTNYTSCTSITWLGIKQTNQICIVKHNKSNTFANHISGESSPKKCKFCHHLLTLMPFQTWMNLVFLCRKKIINVVFCQYNESAQWKAQCCLKPFIVSTAETIFRNFCALRRKECHDDWIFFFGVNFFGWSLLIFYLQSMHNPYTIS